MREEMHYWFLGLGDEEGFFSGEVSHIKVKKIRINTHVILNAVNHKEGRKVLPWHFP